MGLKGLGSHLVRAFGAIVSCDLASPWYRPPDPGTSENLFHASSGAAKIEKTEQVMVRLVASSLSLSMIIISSVVFPLCFLLFYLLHALWYWSCPWISFYWFLQVFCISWCHLRNTKRREEIFWLLRIKPRWSQSTPLLLLYCCT